MSEKAKWVEILWGFTKSNFKLNLKVSSFYLEKQKSFVTKKNIFLAIPPRWIPEMALGDSTFQKALLWVCKLFAVHTHRHQFLTKCTVIHCVCINQQVSIWEIVRLSKKSGYQDARNFKFKISPCTSKKKLYMQFLRLCSRLSNYRKSTCNRH